MHVPAIRSSESARLAELIFPVLKLETAHGSHHTASSAREDEAILRYSSNSALMQLLKNVSVAAPSNHAEAAEAVRSAVASMARDNPAQAVEVIAQLATVNPALADAIVSHVTHPGARFEADSHAPPAIANPFLDASGYTNYTDAAALAQAVINASTYPSWLPEPERRGIDSPPVRRSRRSFAAFGSLVQIAVSKLWPRAPLLILLLGWLGMGLCAGAVMLLLRTADPASPIVGILNTAFDVWGLGFLALVGFGFYMRVRKVRF